VFVAGSAVYGAGDRIRRYVNPEPRASLRYTLSETSSLKASYNRMVQYIHLISNTTAATPSTAIKAVHHCRVATTTASATNPPSTSP